MIKIILAEDQGMLLGALGSLLNMEDDFEVVGTATNGEEAVALVQSLQPDVCVMDIEMPVMNGLEAAELLKEDPCKKIILTTFARTGYFDRARRAGVQAYLLKDSPIEQLAEAIRIVMAGRKMYAPELIVMKYESDVIEMLEKEREYDVLSAVSKELEEKEIDSTLF